MKLFMRPKHKCIHGVQGFLWLQKRYNDFLVHYEFLYQKLQNFGMSFPHGVQGVFFVLNAANLSEENEK